MPLFDGIDDMDDFQAVAAGRVFQSRPVTGITLDVLDVPACGEQPHTLTFYKSNGMNSVQVGRLSSNGSVRKADQGTSARFRCPVISRDHAKFVFEDVGVSVVDLDSHHCTHILKPGDTVQTTLKPLVYTPLSDTDVITFGKSVGKDEELVRPVSVRVRFLYDAAPSSSAASTPTGARFLQRSQSGRYGLHVPAVFSPEDDDESSEHESEMDMEDMEMGEMPGHACDTPSLPSSYGGPLPSLQGLGLLARFIPPLPFPPIRFASGTPGLSSASRSASPPEADTRGLSFPREQEQAREDADELDSIYDVPSEEPIEFLERPRSSNPPPPMSQPQYEDSIYGHVAAAPAPAPPRPLQGPVAAPAPVFYSAIQIPEMWLPDDGDDVRSMSFSPPASPAPVSMGARSQPPGLPVDSLPGPSDRTPSPAPAAPDADLRTALDRVKCEVALLHSQRRRLKNRLMAHIKGAGERARDLEDCVRDASRRVAGVEERVEGADVAAEGRVSEALAEIATLRTQVRELAATKAEPREPVIDMDLRQEVQGLLQVMAQELEQMKQVRADVNASIAHFETVRIEMESETSKKRKRADDDEQDAERDLHMDVRKHKRLRPHRVARAVGRTVAAATVGAVATWGVLAFS